MPDNSILASGLWYQDRREGRFDYCSGQVRATAGSSLTRRFRKCDWLRWLEALWLAQWERKWRGGRGLLAPWHRRKVEFSSPDTRLWPAVPVYLIHSAVTRGVRKSPVLCIVIGGPEFENCSRLTHAEVCTHSQRRPAQIRLLSPTSIYISTGVHFTSQHGLEGKILERALAQQIQKF